MSHRPDSEKGDPAGSAAVVKEAEAGAQTAGRSRGTGSPAAPPPLPQEGRSSAAPPPLPPPLPAAAGPEADPAAPAAEADAGDFTTRVFAPGHFEAAAPPVPGASPPAAPLATARPAGGSGGRRGLLLGLAAVAVLALGAAGAWIFLRPEPGDAQAPQTPETGLPAPTADQAQPGSLLLEAVPWGELTLLEDAEGRELPLPAEPYTPLLLSLPPGGYRLEVRHPGASEGGTCTVEVKSGEVTPCRVELVAIEPLDYFEEAGWWR